MDILMMLQNDADELCKEDLEMIKEELAIGDYSGDYRRECTRIIWRLTHDLEDNEMQKAYQAKKVHTSRLIQSEKETVVVIPEPVVPEPAMNKQETFRAELMKMRTMADPAKRFSEYIANTSFVTNEFIDQNMNEFNERERNELLRKREFSEEFLEKYFDVLDHGTLVINQKFSEEFFMKHFADLNTKLVLTKSKNSWKAKEKRSKKLDTFLRIKGVRI